MPARPADAQARSSARPAGGGEVTRAAEALRRSEARLRAILDTAVDSIITIDDRGLIQSANRATERMFGFAVEELIGRNVSMLMPSPYREEHDVYISRHVRTGEQRIIGIGREVQAQRKDGTVFPVDLAVSEVEPRKLFTGIIRDISDRKIAETRVREADRMASIGTLAAGLGHDMNNVLLPVRARLNALRTSVIPAKERQHVDAIRKSVAYLQQLADGLHFLSVDPERERTEGAATELRAWWAQTGPLISKAVPKHVRVTAALPAHIPEAAVTPQALTQAVLNLVVNAGEAIPPARKRVQGRVRVWADAPAGSASINLGVTDNGSGMPEDVRRRAFEMFYTTKPRGLGTGLGLALVRKLAERAGGSVRIDSELGKGTTVVMSLPVATAKRSGNRLAAVISIRDGRRAALVRQVLESAGAATHVAEDPASADIWVTEPALATERVLEAWHARQPAGRLVLFGKPATNTGLAWEGMDSVMIEDRDDFEGVRAALGRAIGGA